MVRRTDLSAGTTLSDTATPAPSRQAIARLLAEHAPLRAAPLCPDILVHHARSLVDIWQAAESLAGESLPAPFWAYPWAGGCALARVLLDSPALVGGRRVLDFGAGGGVTSLAAARAGAMRVVANDIDAWALHVTEIAAAAQSLAVETLHADICAAPHLVDAFDVVLCSDLSYERSETPRQQHVLERAVRKGAIVLAADAGRTYFSAAGMTLIAEFAVAVPADLEGSTERTARVYRAG